MTIDSPQKKRSFLLIIRIFCEKIGSLPVSKQKWFNHSEEEYRKIPVKSLKQWIKNTKRLFKIHNEKSNERKITEFFHNNDRPVSKVGHKNKIKQSKQPTTYIITIIISI